MKQIKDVMNSSVEVVSPDETIINAAEKMKRHDIGFLPVCDGKKLRGTVTDRDLAIRVLANGKDPEETKIKDIMTKEVVYAYDDDDVEAASELMSKHQVRRLIVLDHNKDLCGLVSVGDIAGEAEEISGETLRNISSKTTARAFARKLRFNTSPRGVLVGIFTGALVVGSVYYLRGKGLFGKAVGIAKRWGPKVVEKAAEEASA